MRNYEVMVILDPDLEERTVQPSLETFLNVVRADGGTVDKLEVWGRRRLAYEINKKSDGIYVVIDLTCESATVKELDRQLSLNDAVLRTKVMRPETSAKSRNADEKAEKSDPADKVVADKAADAVEPAKGADPADAVESAKAAEPAKAEETV